MHSHGGTLTLNRDATKTDASTTSTNSSPCLMVLPQTLPRLPEHELPPNVIIANNVLSDIYQYALRVLGQEQTDPLRVKGHLTAIECDAIPLLLAIDQDNHSMKEWLVATTTQFAALFASLSRYGDDIQNQTDHNVRVPQPVTIIHTGQRGRPRKIIDLAYLKEATATSRNIKLTELARVLGIHRNTLRAYMKKHGNSRQSAPSLVYATQWAICGHKVVVSNIVVYFNLSEELTVLAKFSETARSRNDVSTM
ncbi:hypothetical protein OG21DRAFT_532214 [Imleria badia]|nr:hypothetical protein OG21DRAFT_532214 [Imleria badia]